MDVSWIFHLAIFMALLANAIFLGRLVALAKDADYKLEGIIDVLTQQREDHSKQYHEKAMRGLIAATNVTLKEKRGKKKGTGK